MAIASAAGAPPVAPQTANPDVGVVRTSEAGVTSSSEIDAASAVAPHGLAATKNPPQPGDSPILLELSQAPSPSEVASPQRTRRRGTTRRSSTRRGADHVNERRSEQLHEADHEWTEAHLPTGMHPLVLDAFISAMPELLKNDGVAEDERVSTSDFMRHALHFGLTRPQARIILEAEGMGEDGSITLEELAATTKRLHTHLTSKPRRLVRMRSEAPVSQWPADSLDPSDMPGRREGSSRLAPARASLSIPERSAQPADERRAEVDEEESTKPLCVMPKTLIKAIMHNIPMMLDFFAMLDTDRSGDVTREEWIHTATPMLGIVRLQGSNTAVSLGRVAGPA